MTVLHALAAAVLICSVTSLRLPDLDAKLDINTDLSEASLAVQLFSLVGVGSVWAASLSASPPSCCRTLLADSGGAVCQTLIFLKV